MSVCITVPSCTLLFLQIRISSLSPRSTALNQTLAPSSSLTLPTSTALGATQLCGWVWTWASPRRYFILFIIICRHRSITATRAMASDIDKTLGRLMQADLRVIEQVDQLDDHDRRQAPDLVFAVTIAGHVPTAPLVIDPVSVFAWIFAKELQRHAEHRGDLGIIGLILDKVRDHTDIRRDLDAMQGNQRAERADHFDQPGRQADLFFGFAQGGEHKVGIFRVAAATRKRHFATVGRKSAGTQGQDQFRLVTAGNGHQYGGLGETLVGFQRAWRVVAYPMQ